ncbi:hyalin-like [Acanthaster planci]|uniref:Hyalin-like n=1 Tax=Acanthaster planci TaxID=133434 RepID=A0A8B8A258_ACAPL|nr:hyalin-like [Acanthaster planci]
MAIATWNTLVAIDNSGAVITPTSNSRSGDSFAIGSTTVLYIALDPNNNIGRCEFEVIVIDNELPEFTNCPSDLEVMLMGGENSTLANWTEPIAKDNSGSVNVSLLSQLPSEFLIGRTLVIYTATDPSANTASCSFNVIVFSSDMLMIACPADVILFTDPSVNSSTASWPAPVFNSSIVVAVNSSHANNSRFEVGHAVVTYTIAGKDGRNASCDFFVTVIDNESPVFSRCSSNFVSSASPSMATGTAFWVAPTASDNVGVTKLTSNYEPMAVLPIGITVVTYIAIDAAGNRANCSFNATILDNEDPVFTFCPVTLEFMADAFGNVIVPTSGMPIATDNDGPLSVSTNYNLAMLDVGSTTLVAFTAMDDAENMATCNVNITVIANSGDSPPVFISCPSNIVVSTVMTQSYALVTWAVPQAQDDRSTPIVIEQSGYMPGRQFAIGMWMVIYVATDSIGQTAFCEFNITVLDQEDPVIIGCPANINEVTMNNAPIVVSWTPPTASDNSGEFTLQANDNHAPGEMLNVGMYDVIYTAIDPSGNVANCEFEVIIENDAPPEFISCPSSTVVPTDPGQPYATVSFSYPNPTDDRSSPMLFGSHGPGTQFPIGDTTVTFTAYDSASQSAQCVFVITVEDRGDPVIIDCPSDQTVYVLSTSDVAAVFWTPPTANDTNNFTLTSNRNPGDEFETGSTQVTYTATDVSGNTDTCSFSVVVQETLPTYDTTGSVNLVRIGSIASPFAASDVQTRLPALRDDMDRLFRTSSVSGDFVGITVTGSSVETSDKALIEFVIYFAGSPV